MTAFDAAAALRDTLLLNGCESVTNVSVGMERGIGAKDCPFIRIDPVSTVRDTNINLVTFNLMIYAGINKKNKETESLLERLYQIEECIKDSLDGQYTFMGSEIDNDSLPNLRLIAITCEVKFNGYAC